ncbi:MAG: dihydroxy-acid dehydratase, partial [Methanolinea sp.]
MRSRIVKEGYQRAPNRSLLRSLGVTDGEMDLPFIGIANAWNDIVPGHVHLRTLSTRIREGIAAAGGVPFEFGVIGICDGIAMGHAGMRYSLPSRENIADSIELMVEAHAFDGIVLLGTCDKIVPGMLMAAVSLIDDAARLGRPLTEEAVRHGLEGNLCRCTGYQNIV